MRQVKSEEARRTFRDLLDEAERGGVVQILRYDRPVAVLVAGEWFEHTRAALAAFRESGHPLGGDAPVSANEVRHHVVTLATLLDGMRKIAFRPEGEFRDYWKLLQDETAALADLLPENALEIPGDPS
jgi:antitoxin (DNA-binding transcriptional repressor) of toxin-antitoxin stability system